MCGVGVGVPARVLLRVGSHRSRWRCAQLVWSPSHCGPAANTLRLPALSSASYGVNGGPPPLPGSGLFKAMQGWADSLSGGGRTMRMQPMGS